MRDAVVGDPALVVHAAVDAPETRRDPHSTSASVAAARGKRIEHAHLDIRMRREGGEARVFRARVHIVDQQPHLHAAIGGLEQLLCEVHPREVGVPDVSLNIETARGEPCALRANDEGFRALDHESEGGFAGTTRLASGDVSIERRVLARRKGRLLRQRRKRRQLRACRERDQQEEGREAIAMMS